MTTRTDFLGQEYGVGDIIVYAARAASALWMTKAEVLSFSDRGVPKVQPLESNASLGTDVYFDARNGLQIKWPHCTPECIERARHYRNKFTGERMEVNAYWDVRLDYTDRQDWEYVPAKFYDWVKHEQVIKPVHLPVAANVVLLEKRT